MFDDDNVMIAEQLLKTAPTHIKPNCNDAELFGFTQPSLVNVIPWIKYEAIDNNTVQPLNLDIYVAWVK